MILKFALILLFMALFSLVFEQIWAVFFANFFYRNWPERLVHEEELDSRLLLKIKNSESTNGKIKCEEFDNSLFKLISVDFNLTEMRRAKRRIGNLK